MANRPRRRHEHEAFAFRITSERFDKHDSASVHLAVDDRPRHGPRGLRICAHRGDDADVAAGAAGGRAGQADEDDGRVGRRSFEHRRRRFASEQVGKCRRIDNAPHDRIVCIGGGHDVLAGADGRQ